MLVAFAPGANTSFWIMADWIYEYANEILNTPSGKLVFLRFVKPYAIFLIPFLIQLLWSTPCPTDGRS